LIEVPSCRKHNEDLSRIDEEFRFFLQSACHESQVAKTEFNGRTMRGVMKPEAKNFRARLVDSMAPAIFNGKPATSFSVKVNELRLYFEKVARGIFYHHFEQRFTGEIISANSHISFPGFDAREIIKFVVDHREYFLTGTPTSPYVFTYEIARVQEQMGEGFVLAMKFYDEISCFAIGTTTPNSANPV